MNKNYWDNIYQGKSERELSWYQDIPVKSLGLIAELKIESDASIIDVGGGDSRLADSLLEKGFRNISILDISPTALERAKKRLKDNASLIKFIVSDVLNFNPDEKYNLWHDRATFHFLRTEVEITTYLQVANRAIVPGGNLIVSTFSKTGPDKCSGLPILRYSDDQLNILFESYFTKVRCFEDTHKTPWGTNQGFVYCGFKKR